MTKSSDKLTSATRADVLALSAATLSNALLLIVAIEIILGTSIGVVSVTTLVAVALMVGAFRALRHLTDAEPVSTAPTPSAGGDQAV